MQPASANASACTGDGPALPALSSIIDASAGAAVEDEIVLPDQLERGRRLSSRHGSRESPDSARQASAVYSDLGRLPREELESASQPSGSATSM